MQSREWVSWYKKCPRGIGPLWKKGDTRLSECGQIDVKIHESDGHSNCCTCLWNVPHRKLLILFDNTLECRLMWCHWHVLSIKWSETRSHHSESLLGFWCLQLILTDAETQSDHSESPFRFWCDPVRYSRLSISILRHPAYSRPFLVGVSVGKHVDICSKRLVHFKTIYIIL